MPTAAANRYSIAKLEPFVDMPGATVEFPIRLAPSLTLASATLLGEIIPTQLITLGAGNTGGNFTVTVGGQTTTAIAFNATGATLQTALLLLSTVGAGNAIVTGGAGGPYTITLYTATTYAISTTPALTGGANTAVVTYPNTSTTWGIYTNYASGNTDGSQIPKCILEHACATDASGNITDGTGTAGNEFGDTRTTTPAYFGGWFATQDLVGLDTNALLSTVSTLFNVRKGNLKNGILQLG